MVDERKPTRCGSCGGSDFILLPSAKYKCTYCGAEELPRSITARESKLAGDFGRLGSNKFIWVALVLVAISIGAMFYFTAVSPGEEAPGIKVADLTPLITARAEVLTQRQRTVKILQGQRSFLKSINIRLAENIEYSQVNEVVSQLNKKKLNEQGLRLLDEVSGALNRETVALRRYNQAWLLYRSQDGSLGEEKLAQKGFYPPGQTRQLKQLD